MSELAHHSTDYSVVESEPPQVMARNLRVASQLWASATLFFFFAFLFAYFYLRSLNSEGQWHPHHVQVPVGLGTAITVCVVLSALTTVLAVRRLYDDNAGTWRWYGLVALALGLGAVVLQVIEWATIGFGPTDGGFASVFLGWTGLYILFVFCSMYWLETLLATSYRYRSVARPAPGEASGDAERTGDDIEQPLSLIGPSARAFAFYWAVLAGIGVATWVILYLL